VTRDIHHADIYVDTAMPELELAEQLAKIVGGRIEPRATVVARHVDFQVTTNDDDGRAAVDAGEDAFLYFPYVVEVFADENCEQRLVVAEVSAALTALDGLGARYATAADFEADLPRGGRNEG
jgi:hypothetical protein